MATYSWSMSDRGELARETEQEAIQLVKTYLADLALVKDLSDSQEYDFEIYYKDGRRGIGEIGLLANPAYESAWAALRSREKQHFVSLPSGQGTWGTHLYGNPSIKRFESEISEIIAELNYHGADEFYIGMHPEMRELSKKCEALGIQYLLKHNNIPEDQVVYFLDMGQPIFIDSTLESLVKSVEAALFQGDFQDSWKKLEAHSSDEKHLVFKCGSLIPLNHQQVLLKSEPTPDIPDISFPKGVTHIWLLPRYVEAFGLLWSVDGKKQLLDR